MLFLGSLGLPGWFRHEYHAHVRLRFKLAAGLGEPWTRDGGIPQGCPLSMMFIVALYLPWCRYLSAQVGVEPQLYADNLKCTSRDPALLLHAAWFTTGYVRLVGQEPAPSKCVLLSTSRAVRDDMRNWVLLSLMCVILVVTWIPLFGDGLLLWLLEFVWFSLVWF